jgi:GT2 family glycosyltransferase
VGVNAVVVSYNNRATLRACVEPLTRMEDVDVFVVDNASSDDSPAAVQDLPVSVIRLPENRGFAYGCNRGWEAGAAPYVLFVNPDARIDEASLRRLCAALAADDGVGIAAPKIVDATGRLSFSLRRFPRLRSTFAQALFLHRLFPTAPWVDELERDPVAYERARPVEWASGACVLIRRFVLEQLGGLDEGFFMYCEDMDLCRRAWSAGYQVRFVPDAVVTHVGGVSAPYASLLPVLATSRLRYAQKHEGRVHATLERAGIVLGGLTHAVITRGGRSARAGHARAAVTALRPRNGPRPV